MRAWITKNSVSGQDHKILTGSMTIEDDEYFSVSFYSGLKQIHISVDRELLIVMRDAINKELSS